MSQVTRSTLVLVAVALAPAGCAKPIKLNVAVQQAQMATITTRLKEGKVAPIPAQCQTPCAVDIAPDTTNEMTVESSGYYPATFEFTYQEVMTAPPSDGAVNLVVPMVAREALEPSKSSQP